MYSQELFFRGYFSRGVTETLVDTSLLRYIYTGTERLARTEVMGGT